MSFAWLIYSLLLAGAQQQGMLKFCFWLLASLQPEMKQTSSCCIMCFSGIASAPLAAHPDMSSCFQDIRKSYCFTLLQSVSASPAEL